MTVHYLFDIDGTLTEPRQQMTQHFADKFLDIMKDRTYSLVTGSDMPKVREQVLAKVFDRAEYIFASMGNNVWHKGEEIVKASVLVDEALIELLKETLHNSQYPYRTGNHIEVRPGMINISTVGRNATHSERKEYSMWDNRYNERVKIANHLRPLLPDYDILIGGAISIDIMKKGCGKEQVLKYITGDVFFYGDRIEPGGNDWSLAVEIFKLTKNRSGVFPVLSPDHTLNLLKEHVSDTH
jgi:phosphomannomutase